MIYIYKSKFWLDFNSDISSFRTKIFEKLHNMIKIQFPELKIFNDSPTSILFIRPFLLLYADIRPISFVKQIFDSFLLGFD